LAICSLVNCTEFGRSTTISTGVDSRVRHVV
jgi:hypothetical protein